MQTKQIVLASRPAGSPTAANFRFQEIELPTLNEGDILLEGKFYSVDPYMRGRMNDAKSYAPPFKVDEPIEGAVVAKVKTSKHPDFTEGQMVTGRLPWQEYAISNGKGLTKVDSQLVPASYYLGILGMTGLTAYFGLMDIGKPKNGETVVVSGAAGAVGMVVGQIAKLQGCRVIGIAGSDEKNAMLKNEYGFDDTINYKTTKNIKEEIGRLCPDGVDIYFDNVGGEISDAVIDNINFHARIPLCGQISLYNSASPEIGPRIQPMLLTRSVLMQGFIIGNYSSRFPEGIRALSQWVAEGKLKAAETIVKGFDTLPQSFIGLFDGANTGKMVVEA